MNRTLNLALATLCAVLGAGPLAGCHEARNESIRLMNEGLQLVKRDRAVDAVKQFARAGETDPTNDRAFYYQGMVMGQKLGEHDKAVVALRKAIELSDQKYEYHYQLGAVLAKKKLWAPANAALAKSIALKPEHAESHFRQGQAFEQMEQFDRAQEAYRNAIEHDPWRPEAYNALGNLYLRFEQHSHAVQVFKNAVENNPRSVANYRDLGVAYRQQNRLDDAIRQFERAQQVDPRDSGTLFNLGMTQRDRGETREAVFTLKRYLMARTASEDALRLDLVRGILTKMQTQLQKAPR
jgi:tetratricopeptide (TPR) repeat protein